ncbi:hypothetical protein B5X24_HaOG208041 [Helicoverpa armigera]|nr:hypothetical protein B5X24_HaOG208041 [Helicoverpa armigera]
MLTVHFRGYLLAESSRTEDQGQADMGAFGYDYPYCKRTSTRPLKLLDVARLIASGCDISRSAPSSPIFHSNTACDRHHDGEITFVRCLRRNV